MLHVTLLMLPVTLQPPLGVQCYILRRARKREFPWQLESKIIVTKVYSKSASERFQSFGLV